MTGLVYIGKILKISPIPEAERIETATVVCGKGGKWQGIVQKGVFQERDLCRVYLPDCIVPQTEEFAFMAQYAWRVRIQKIRGVLSECLIMPYSSLGDIGDDITVQSGIERYTKVLPLDMIGRVWGPFPSFIPKTDEPNYQTAPEMVDRLYGERSYSTIKYDGASCTMYYHNGHFGVCSRTREIREGDNIHWQIAREYDVEYLLRSLGEPYALQMELVGPKIQGNSLGLLAVQPRLFDVFHITLQRYAPLWCLWLFNEALPLVKIVYTNQIFSMTSEDLQEYAAAQVYEGTDTPAEGVVIRSINLRPRISFKVINPLYKEE